MGKGRESWGSQIGFILAAAGSAIGLGNIWRFPYMTGQNGGAVFLIVYLVLVFTIGISAMLAEMAIGRAAQKNPVGAFAALKGGLWPIVGFINITGGFVILSFYSVVAGWTIAYIFKSFTGLATISDPKVLGDMFNQFISDPIQPLIYHAIFMTLTVAIVIGGVSGGIEKWCKILMPALFVILLVLIVRTLTLPGAGKGLAFYLKPDFSKLNAKVVYDALSQAFFSLSLGEGVMITYGSYLAKDTNLPRSSSWVTFLDTLVAFLAGLIIMPAVFVFGFNPAAGPGLTFITLPAVFSKMPGGMFWAALFFVLLLIAALTSSIALLEVVVAYFVDEKGMSRKTAAILFGLLAFLLGIPSSLSLGVWSNFKIMGKTFLNFMDYLSSNILLPTGGIFITLFVGWIITERAKAEATNNGKIQFAWEGLWMIVCKFIAPIAIVWILITEITKQL